MLGTAMVMSPGQTIRSLLAPSVNVDVPLVMVVLSHQVTVPSLLS